MISSFRITLLLCALLIQSQIWAASSMQMNSPVVSEEKKNSGTKKNKPGHITLNFQDVSLKNTLQLLCDRLGKNLLVDSEIEDRTLNMNFKDIAPLDAFNAILQVNNLAYKEMQGNILFVAKAQKIGNRMVIKHIKCKYADSEDLVKILHNIVSADSGAIIADKRTNTLIVRSIPEIITRIESLIQELDKPTKQVYIQAEIVEVSSTNNEEFGVEWLWKNTNGKAKIGTDFRLTPILVTSETSLGSETSTPLPFPSGSGLGIGILKTNVEAVLHALAENNNVNLLSRPRIITMDNQEAVIEVGDQIPYKKLNQFGVTSFEFKDATVQLVVKPHIIDSEYILLEVAPKADFQNGFTPDGTPIISTRKASTNVKVKDGQTIVIGGLIRDSLIKNQTKVPILGDIPFLGLLFKSTKTTKVKTELIVFITPVILKDEEQEVHFEDDFQLRYRIRKSFNHEEK